MEESDLLKERLQAITEKHRIQENIRQKKLELDQEKLKLQHLKKKALREQWLLRDSHNAGDHKQQQNLLSDQQQTRALQLRIHRIEMEVESLEREESMISTNESFILSRLKAVEKSPEEIIKEAQDSFVPEPLRVTTAVPSVPESLCSPASEPSEPNTPRKTLFAVEINVTKNPLTGGSTVLSTADVPPEDLDQHTSLQVYDDGRKCVYALNSQQGSPDHGFVPELSASELERLLRSVTVHRQVERQHDRGERDGAEGRDPRKQAGRRVPRRHVVDCRENWQGNPHDERRCGHDERRCGHDGSRHCRNEESNLRGSRHKGLDRQQDCCCTSYQVRNCHGVQAGGSAGHHANGVPRSSSSGVNGSRANGYPPRSHEQEAMSAYQPQFSYTPTYIPPVDYVSEEERFCCGPPPFQPSRQLENSHSRSTAHYSGPAHCRRAPSPLYQDDAPYTILNTLDTSEPITAIFMGFQTAQDDSGQVQEFEGSLKAELVVIEDNEDSCEDGSTKKSRGRILTGRASNGAIRRVQGVGDGHADRRAGPGIRKIQKKRQQCCSVC